MSESILETVKKLELSSVYGHLLTLKDNNKFNENDYKGFNELLQLEIEFRKTRSMNYRLKLSKFPEIKLLANTEQAVLLKAVDILEIIKNKRNIMFIGGAGSGKTHLSLAVGYDLLLNGKKVIYYKLHELANLLLRYKLTNSHIKFYNKLCNFNMIIIDEFGYIPIDKEASYLLYELFSKLYCNTTIMLNTHLKFEEWGNLFGIDKTTKVIIDRITQNCQFIETGNKSFRHK